MARNIGRAAAKEPNSFGASGRGEPAVLGSGARIRGRVAGDGDLRVEGEIEGPVTLRGDLVVDERASVTGDVEAASVVVGGTLVGDVAAQGSVAVRAGARVQGTLRGEAVSIEEGASVSGRIEAQFDMPAELTAGRR